MENIENMNEGVKNVVNEVAAANNPVVGNGVGIAIGIGVTLAIGVGGWLIKIACDAFNASKETNKPDHEIEVTDEDVDKVTAK